MCFSFCLFISSIQTFHCRQFLFSRFGSSFFARFNFDHFIVRGCVHKSRYKIHQFWVGKTVLVCVFAKSRKLSFVVNTTNERPTNSIGAFYFLWFTLWWLGFFNCNRNLCFLFAVCPFTYKWMRFGWTKIGLLRQILRLLCVCMCVCRWGRQMTKWNAIACILNVRNNW